VQQFEAIRKLRAETEKLQAEARYKERILEAINDTKPSEGVQPKDIAARLIKGNDETKYGEDAELQKSLENSISYIENLTVNGGTVNVYITPGQLESNSPNEWQKELLENRKSQVQPGRVQALIEDK
jgi:hypothetical protein